MMNVFSKRAIAVLMALCLLAASPALSALAQEPTSGTETIVTETQQTSSAKSTYRYKYTVGTPTGVSGADYMWTLGTASAPREVVLRYDLHDATVSFKPYVNGQRNCNTLIDVYASKDGTEWYQLVDGQYVGTGANYGFIADTATFAAPADVTNKPWGGTAWGYYDWDNYNNANMTAVLTDNPQKVVYLKFTNGGAPSSGTEASELQGFGISSAWDTTQLAPPTVGKQTIVTETQQTASAKSTYRFKYLDTSFGTHAEVAGMTYLWTLGTASATRSLVFRYDLDDATVSFKPYIHGSGSCNTTVDVYGSKDGVYWYPLVDGQYVGTGANHGFIADTTTFTAPADVTNKPWGGTAWGYYDWDNYDTANMNTILADNPQKIVYLKFAHGGAPTSGTDTSHLQGFGISSAWDTTQATPATRGSETYVGEVLNRVGLATADDTKANYFNTYFVSDQSTRFVSITGANWVVKIGGAYTDNLQGTYVFKYDLRNDTTSFTPFLATADYTQKISVYASRDGKSWLPLVEEAAPGSQAFVGDADNWVPHDDVQKRGTLTAWQHFNTASMLAVLADNPTKTVYLKYVYVGDGTGEAQVQSFGITSSWNEAVGTTPATAGVQNFISRTDNRDGYGETDPSASHYFGKYLVADDSSYHPLSYLVKMYIPAHRLVFKYDLHDSTVAFTPYMWGSGDNAAAITVEASKDGIHWLTLVDGEQTGVAHYGDPINTSHAFATGQSTAVTAWSALDTANVAAVLADNPNKIVYLRYTYAGEYKSDGTATVECQLQGFGITGVWNETGYETHVGEVHNRDDLSGCGSVHTDDAGRAKENYFNRYLVAAESTYTALNGSLIKLGGNYAKNGYLTFCYDLNDETTAFYPYLYTAGDYTAELSVYASKDGVEWLPLVLRERLSRGQYRGDDASFKPHADVDNVGTLVPWTDYDVDNMQLVLADNPQKTVYLKFIYSGTGADEAQVSALGITSTYDTVPYRDPSLPTGSTSVILREELLAATDNRDGYDGTDKSSTTYLNQYLVSDQCAYTPLYHLIKLTKGNKMVMKFDLNDLTESFTPWMKVGGDKYSVVRLRGSKDGRNWVDLATHVPADPGTTYGTVTAWPQFDTAAAAALLTDNAKKVVYLSFEYEDGALNPQTGKRDEETQLHGIGIIGEHAATALSAEITAVGKTEYAINDEELDIANSIISVTYDTDETIAYAFADADVRGFIPAMPGEQTIYVEKHGIVASYTVTVDAQPIVGVTVTTMPHKLVYEMGDKLSVTGGKVTVTFADDTTDERLLAMSMVSGFNSTKVTETLTLTVRVGYAKTTYDVRITEKTKTVFETIRMDATPFVSHDGLFEMMQPEDQQEDHNRLLEQRKQNDCEDDGNLGELIVDSKMALTTPTDSPGVLLNVFAGGYITVAMDLNDRAVDFQLTRGWGTYRNMKILASKDGGKTWYLVGRVLDEVSGSNTIFTSTDLSQEQIDKNIEWILTGNPEKKFLLKYEADMFGSVEGDIRISNIMLDVYYNVGPRMDLDLPTEVPEGYVVPRAYKFGMLASEREGGDDYEYDDDIVWDDSLLDDSLTDDSLWDDSLFDDSLWDDGTLTEPPAEDQPQEDIPSADTLKPQKKPNGNKQSDGSFVILYVLIICVSVVAILASWTAIFASARKLKKITTSVPTEDAQPADVENVQED